MFKRLFCWAYCRRWGGGGLFSEGLIIGRKFAFQNGLGLTIKQLAVTVHGFIFGRAYYRKDFCVCDLGGLFWGGLIFGWGGLLSEGYLSLRFGGLIFGRAYFWMGGGGGGLIIGILRYFISGVSALASGWYL